MTKNVPFQTVIEALQDTGNPFPARFLHQFSDMPPENLSLLMQIWPAVATKRKHTLLEDLEELAETDTLTCFGDLARSLLNDPDPQVRIHAIHLLWEDEDSRLARTFMKILRHDEVADVRAASANALGLFVYLGEVEKIHSELHDSIVNILLLAAKTDEALIVRRRALESLGYSGSEDVNSIIDAAYHDKDPDWVVSALFAMGRSSDERWKKQVLSKLHDPEEEIRVEAIHAAGELELAAARSILLDMLEDEEDVETRREIIWALSKIGGEGVRERLEEVLEAEEDDGEADFIVEAMDNLTFLQDMPQFDILDLDPEIDLIEDEDESDEEEGLDEE
jgi:hypothetical protein